jgi:HK97 family phage major capsid protein
MKKFSIPFFAAVLALLAVVAVAMGVDLSALAAQHGDVVSGLSLMGMAGTMEVKDLLPVIEGVKAAASERLNNLDVAQREVADRLLQLEQKGSLPSANEGATPGNGSNVGDLVAKDAQISLLRDGSAKAVRIAVKSFPLGRKAAAVTNYLLPGASTPASERDKEIYGPLVRRISVRDLLITRPTASASIEYMRGTTTGGPAVQAYETDNKAEIALQFELRNAVVRTVACWVPASRQVIDDTAAMGEYIETTLLNALQLEEDRVLLVGDSSGPGLMAEATAYNRAVTGDKPIDTIRRAITQVQLARGVASGIIINPVGLERLELQKDADGGYIMGFAVTDGNGRTTSWRVPVVVTDAVGTNDFLVGDFLLAARLYDRQVAAVEVSNQHQDFFTRNMLAFLAEERLALAVMRPGLLVKGTLPA